VSCFGLENIECQQLISWCVSRVSVRQKSQMYLP
jgi:hypothetical protein